MQSLLKRVRTELLETSGT